MHLVDECVEMLMEYKQLPKIVKLIEDKEFMVLKEISEESKVPPREDPAERSQQ